MNFTKLENKWASFEINRVANAYQLTWHEVPNLEQAQDVLQTAYTIHLKNPLNWIIDTRALEFQNPEIDHWIFNEWLPQLIESGVFFVATLIPEERYLRLKNTEPQQPYPQFDFTSAFFYHSHDAKNYIRKVSLNVTALSA